MAEAAALGALIGGVMNTGVKLVTSKSSTFVARHENSHKDQIAILDKNIEKWETMPPEETNTDDEEEFETRRGRARSKIRKYEDHLDEYRQMSGWRNPIRKSVKRCEVRSAKRESRKSVSSVREYVEDTSDRRRVSSRASSRTSSSRQTSPGVGPTSRILEQPVRAEPPIKVAKWIPIRVVIRTTKPRFRRIRIPPPISLNGTENNISDAKTLSQSSAGSTPEAGSFNDDIISKLKSPSSGTKTNSPVARCQLLRKHSHRTVSVGLRKITSTKKTTWGWLPVVCAITSTITPHHGIRTKVDSSVDGTAAVRLADALDACMNV